MRSVVDQEGGGAVVINAVAVLEIWHRMTVDANFRPRELHCSVFLSRKDLWTSCSCNMEDVVTSMHLILSLMGLMTRIHRKDTHIYEGEVLSQH